MDKKTKLLLTIIIGLVLIQGIRIIVEYSVFCFFERTPFADTLVSAVIMAGLTLAGIIIARQMGIALSVFPNQHKTLYAIATVVVLGLIGSTPFVTAEGSVIALVSLAYSALITPIFEELLFRGYVWNKLEESFGSKLSVYVITTVLFALWHIGYVDVIAYRVASDHLPFVMLMKVVTGLCFGMVLGAVRYKTENCYSTMLLHGLMNLFGR